MTNLKTSTLRPGLLVVLKTSVVGNTHYYRNVIEAEHVTEEGSQKARWETERTIQDPVEHDAAGKVRSKARGLIRAVCAESTFGLLCPEDKATELDAAIGEARKLAEEFNAGAKLSRIHVYVMAGRVAPDDVEAVKAINSEIRDLLADMERGVKNCDAKVIRDAASKAKSIGAMLSADAAARIQVAIDAAREAARKIVKAGEQAAVEVDRNAVARITGARTAFLDLEEPTRDVEAPVPEARVLDLAPTSEPVKKIDMVAPAIEM